MATPAIDVQQLAEKLAKSHLIGGSAKEIEQRFAAAAGPRQTAHLVGKIAAEAYACWFSSDKVCDLLDDDDAGLVSRERAAILAAGRASHFREVNEDGRLYLTYSEAPTAPPASGLSDSGAREADRAGGGSAREPEGERGRFDLVPLEAVQAVAVHLGKGAAKYEAHNWRKGMAYSRCISSALRHLMQFAAGRTDEDHLAAVACNVVFLLTYRADVAAGKLPATLDDRYQPEATNV